MTSTETQRQYPWPFDEDAVTRDHLVRHFAEQAQLSYGALDVYELSSPEWHRTIASVSHAFSCCLLLMNLPNDTADGVARTLVGDLNDGGSCSEWIWQWLDEWDMDADAISRRGAQMARDQLAKAAASTETTEQAAQRLDAATDAYRDALDRADSGVSS